MLEYLSREPLMCVLPECVSILFVVCFCVSVLYECVFVCCVYIICGVAVLCACFSCVVCVGECCVCVCDVCIVLWELCEYFMSCVHLCVVYALWECPVLSIYFTECLVNIY